MALVKVVKEGQMVVEIYDDYYKDKTKEQVQEIIDDISRRVSEYYRKTAG